MQPCKSEQALFCRSLMALVAAVTASELPKLSALCMAARKVACVPPAARVGARWSALNSSHG